MTRTARWTLVVAVLMSALLVAFVVEFIDSRDSAAPGDPAGSAQDQAARDHRDVDTPAALAGPRARADLQPCPTGDGGPGPERLRDVEVQCAGNGVPVNVGRAVAGIPTVINLWAYWCAPCAHELPALAEYQRRMGTQVQVLTVHQDENAEAGLLRLAELGVHLPTLQDGRRQVAAALRAPNVMPATVVLRADGTVAQVLPRAFTSADEIEEAVGDLR